MILKKRDWATEISRKCDTMNCIPTISNKQILASISDRTVKAIERKQDTHLTILTSKTYGHENLWSLLSPIPTRFAWDSVAFQLVYFASTVSVIREHWNNSNRNRLTLSIIISINERQFSNSHCPTRNLFLSTT